ncbi:hypothetical protein KY358_07100 [Candidatus Woesearchaeota archaeon]|nr:hypothetical protein [Candidatus Woesearchaeota archaeon]
MRSVKKFQLSYLPSQGNAGLAYLLDVSNKKILVDIGSPAGLLVDSLKKNNILFDDIDFFFLARGYGKSGYTLSDLWLKFKEASRMDTEERLRSLFSPFSMIRRLVLKEEEKKRLEELKKEEMLSKIQNAKSIKKPFEIMDGVMLSGLLHHADAEDILLYINIEKKGLVIMTGCTYPGIYSIIAKARRITGIKNIYGLVINFSLDEKNAKELGEKAAALNKEKPPFILVKEPAGPKALKILDKALKDSPSCLIKRFAEDQKITIP